MRGGDLGVRYRMLSWRGGRRVEDKRSRSTRVGPQQHQQEAGGVSARGHGSPSPVPNSHSSPPRVSRVSVCLAVCVGSLLRTCAARVVPAVTATPATPATLATLVFLLLLLLLAFTTFILVAHLVPQEVAPLWPTFMALVVLIVACCIILTCLVL